MRLECALADIEFITGCQQQLPTLVPEDALNMQFLWLVWSFAPCGHSSITPCLVAC